MKKAIVFLSVFFIGVTCYAQQDVVAVAPCEAKSGISVSDAHTVTEMFIIQLSSKRIARVVTRAAIDKVIREHQFQTGDWSDDRKTAELGKALNANWVVHGTLQKLDGSFIITVSILNVKTPEVMGGGLIRMASIDEAFDLMNDLVDQTAQTMTGGSENTNETAKETRREY
jgi:TolB-like protein